MTGANTVDGAAGACGRGERLKREKDERARASGRGEEHKAKRKNDPVRKRPRPQCRATPPLSPIEAASASAQLRGPRALREERE